MWLIKLITEGIIRQIFKILMKMKGLVWILIRKKKKQIKKRIRAIIIKVLYMKIKLIKQEIVKLMIFQVNLKKLILQLNQLRKIHLCQILSKRKNLIINHPIIYQKWLRRSRIREISVLIALKNSKQIPTKVL